MAIKGRIRMLLSFSCFLVLMGHSYSQRDKLLQGEELKDGEQLVSASRNFKLEFFTPSSMPKSSKRYIGVWYNKPKDRAGFGSFYSSPSTKAVWVANRNIPILDKSASLRIDSSDGNLKIFHNGENPIQISWVQGARNTSVTLLQTGNLVLHGTHLNGSIKQVLWQSFDYPTDTLLPGMKLGINLQTGHQWFLQSWLTDDSPAQGSFTVGMDQNVTNQLTVWRRGQVDRTSGHLLNGKFKSWAAIGYNFSYTSNEREKYFSYSASEDITSFPMLAIDSAGRLSDDSGESITSCSLLDEYCESSQRHRMCNSSNTDFHLKFGWMSGDGTKFKEGDSMMLADCRQKCYKNCSCVAYAATNRANDTGCEVWSRGTMFKESNDDNNRQIYVEYKYPDEYEEPRIAERKYKGKEKWWQSLMIVLLVPLLCYFCYLAWRKLTAEVQRIMNRRKLLRELGDDVSSPTINNKKDQATKYVLKIFNFQTIVAATNNFSTANKLGEGGFGLVYKGKLLDGREIAIKRLSRRSGQGIVEFKNEAKLIAKLQHTNLVKLVGCSLQGEERILVYEYMQNKSLNFFIFGYML